MRARIAGSQLNPPVNHESTTHWRPHPFAARPEGDVGPARFCHSDRDRNPPLLDGVCRQGGIASSLTSPPPPPFSHANNHDSGLDWFDLAPLGQIKLTAPRGRSFGPPGQWHNLSGYTDDDGGGNATGNTTATAHGASDHARWCLRISRSSKLCFPIWIGLGVGDSGTTALWQLMLQLPGATTGRGKEPRFWTPARTSACSVPNTACYATVSPAHRATPADSYWGDMSVSHLQHLNTPLFFEHLHPSPRFLLHLREPRDNIWANRLRYIHWVQGRGTNASRASVEAAVLSEIGWYLQCHANSHWLDRAAGEVWDPGCWWKLMHSRHTPRRVQAEAFESSARARLQHQAPPSAPKLQMADGEGRRNASDDAHFYLDGHFYLMPGLMADALHHTLTHVPRGALFFFRGSDMRAAATARPLFGRICEWLELPARRRRSDSTMASANDACAEAIHFGEDAADNNRGSRDHAPGKSTAGALPSFRESLPLLWELLGEFFEPQQQWLSQILGVPISELY